MKTMRWQQHCVGVATAAWLLIGSGVAFSDQWGLSVPFAPMANAMAVAVALVVFATFALVLHLNWNGRATLSITAWALAVSTMLRATHAWMPVLLLGLAALALCGALLLTAPPSTRRRDGHRA